MKIKLGLVSLATLLLISFVFLRFTSVAQAVPSNNPFFATIEFVEGLFDTLDGKVTDLENAPPPSSQSIRIFDFNDVELGIYSSERIFFYPPLDRFIPIDEETGKLGDQQIIYYSNPDCKGTPYGEISDGNNLRARGRNVISPDLETFYILEKGILEVNDVVTKSRMEFRPVLGNCIDDPSEDPSVKDLRELTEVNLLINLNIPDPIALPLQYKYE